MNAVSLLQLLIYPGAAVVYFEPLVTQSIHRQYYFFINFRVAPLIILEGLAVILSKSNMAIL